MTTAWRSGVALVAVLAPTRAALSQTALPGPGATHPSILADLSSTVPHPRIHHLPGFDPLRKATPANFLGSLQEIDGWYFTVHPSLRVARYRRNGAYYLLPAEARFTSRSYGFFCGAGWGLPGNVNRNPLADGGLDAACRAHDEAWATGTATAVLAGDSTFLESLRNITPVWQVEADFVLAAREWMSCRVRFRVDVPRGPNEPRCGMLAIRVVVDGIVMGKRLR